MSYSRTTWIPEETPLSADNFNNIEDGIEESLNRLDAIASNTELFNAIYPIGSIYMSTSSTNPAAYFGGTWVAWGQGRVPVGVNTSDTSFNAVEKTGGIKDAVLPSHSHSASFVGTPVAAHTHYGPDHTHSLNLDTQLGGLHHHSSKTRTVAASGSAARSGAYPQSTSYSDSYEVYTSDAGDHTHHITGATDWSGAGRTTEAGAHTPAGTVTVTSSGESVTDKNLQPYITCYMWKRTA